MSQARRRGGKWNFCSLSAPAVAFSLTLHNVFIPIIIFLILFGFVPLAWAVPPGTPISNTATVDYLNNGTPASVGSNTLTITSVALRTPSTLELFQYAPPPAPPGAVSGIVTPTDYLDSGSGTYLTLPEPVAIGGAALTHGSTMDMVTANQYHIGEPVFIRVTDIDQNTDPATPQTIVVTVQITATGETETLRLTETGNDTGVFFGHIQTALGTAASGNGTLETQPDSGIQATYTDAADGTDTSSMVVLVDPNGLVFNSLTGLPIDNVTITITDAATGLAAVVFADDGVTPFPSTVVTGSTFTVGATTYSFPPGGYRFPFIQPGTYQYQITPPSFYRAPSVVPTAQIQALPTGPFAIVPGSRGETFIVNPGPAVHIDIPLDPANNAFFISKTAGKSAVGPGDVLPYRLSIENVSATNPILNAIVTDRLPPGFRYRSGSTRVDGAQAPDPAVSADGLALSFTLGDIAAGRTAVVTYVATVGAGAKTGPAVNTATASGDLGATSNVATATVLVQEDLFRSTATIVGRLLVDGCGDPDKAEDKNVDGIRLLLEDGTSVTTDRNGMYHFAAVKPGSHVVQIDLDTLPARYEVIPCEMSDRLAGRDYSQFVDVQGGALWRADFHLALKPKMRGQAGVQLLSVLPGGEQATVKRGDRRAKNRLDYFATVETSTVPLRNVRLTIMLPPGVAYLPGSSMLDYAQIGDPEIFENALTFRLGDVEGGWSGTVWFATEVRPLAGIDHLIAKALVTADTPDAPNVRTPAADNIREMKILEKRTAVPDLVLRPRFASLSARLSRRDRNALNKLLRRLKPLRIMHISVIGHTDSIPIRGRAKKKFRDNYQLADARARAVAAYIRKGLHLGEEDVEIVAKGPDDPLAPNNTAKGRAANRRVELKVYKEFVIVWTELDDSSESSGFRTVETVGLRPGEVWSNRADAASAAEIAIPDFDQAWIEKAEPGLELLWPSEGSYPRIPSTRIAVKHDPSWKIFLRVNDADIDPLYFEGMRKRQDASVAVSLWRGIHLADGDNTIAVEAYSENGAKIGGITRTIHYSGPPETVELVPDQSVLTADGRTVPVIALRLLDRDGHPAREGMSGEYSVNPPHLPRKRVDELQENPLTAAATIRQTYEVSKNGIVRIELQPTTVTGDAVIRLYLASGVQEVRSWLASEDREWVLVGLAEGTAGYNTVSGNMEGLDAAGVEERLYSDGRLAFYAKGRILGKWLLTIAYDSDKKWRKEQQALQRQEIDPNRYYMLYGDATEQQAGAPSMRSLYLKLERGQFYALFGDYMTGLTVTELSRYNRSFNGFKSELKSEKLDVAVFASDTNQSFIKDEIRGDGTSGLYRLSRTHIVLNSETVTIEMRDRYRSEVIVSSERMSRWLDYTIDYENGTIFFKAPVPNRDANFNPVFIVVDYESFDDTLTSWNYGGRVAVRPAGRGLEVGVTHISEGVTGRDGTLTGADATVLLDDRTKLRAEVAATRTDSGAVSSSGEAYLAEIVHRSDTIEGSAYVREQDPAFGLGQQSGSESGTRKLGLTAAYRFDKITSVRGEAFRQENLSTGAKRDMAEIQGRRTRGVYDLGAGLRFAEDAFVTGEVRTAEQLFMSLGYRMNDRLSLRFGHDQSLSGKNGNNDFPTRTVMAAEYALSGVTNVFAAQELTQGSNGDTSTSRLGFRTSPWSGSAMTTSMESQQTELGTRLFSLSGMKQTWQLSEAWSVDAGLDRSATFHQTASAPFNVNVPPASGGEDFTAVSLGAAYRTKGWSWTGRIERRHSTLDDKLGLLMGAAGEPQKGLGLAAGIHAFRTDAVSGAATTNADVRLGIAYRPKKTDWIVLDRLEYRVDEQTGGVQSIDSRRIVNNLVLNYRRAFRYQLSFQYGAKYVAETIDALDYSGYTDLTGVEFRYDVTRTWDIGIRGNMLHTRETDQMDCGAGISVGHTLAQNMWISIGYNVTGFSDRDFSQAEYTAEGVFLKLRMKFDQASVRDAIKWFSGQ